MSYIEITVEDEQEQQGTVLIERELAPRYGEWLEENGVKLRRIPDVLNIKVKEYRFRCLGAPFKENLEKSGMAAPEHYDSDGVGAFSTRKGCLDYMARVNDSPNDGVRIEFD